MDERILYLSEFAINTLLRIFARRGLTIIDYQVGPKLNGNVKTSEKLNRLLEDRGISQSELARKCGFAQSRVNNWINGKGRMYADQAYKVCQFLSVSADWLLDEVGNEDIPATPPQSEPVDKFEFLVSEVIKSVGAERAWRRLIGMDEAPFRNLYSRQELADEPPARRGAG